MTLFEALRPVVPQYQTDDQLYRMIREGIIVNTGDPIKDPNHIVHEGDKLRVGFITWMAHDIARRKVEIDDAPSDVPVFKAVCPHCGGEL